jgi:hypothetical protein
MSGINPEKPGVAAEIDEAQRNKSVHEHEMEIQEKVDYNRSGAIDAENLEHRMTVLQAVRAYPSASWWAFVMSCTIVRDPLPISHLPLTCVDHGSLLCVPDGFIHRASCIRQTLR